VDEEHYAVQEAAKVLRTTERPVRRLPTCETGLARTRRPYKTGLALQGIWSGRRAPSTLAPSDEAPMNSQERREDGR
jgi:hypothetical protein